MTWTRHPDYLTRTIGGLTIDWTPEEGARLTLSLDSLAPDAFAEQLRNAAEAATTCTDGALEVWEATCDTSP